MRAIETFRIEFLKYKALAEKALAQVEEVDLSRDPGGDANSIAVICWHVSGNLRSRFTDFLTSDGEKPWRHRDEEFEARTVSRAALMEKWEAGWSALVSALDGLTDEHLAQAVTIRGEAHTVLQALVRALAHVASHVGQMVYIGKLLKGDAWTSLSIPRGQSEQFTRSMLTRPNP